MSKQIPKSARPVTAHSVADKISEERKCYNSLGASLNLMLKQAGEHQSEYYDIPDDLDVDNRSCSSRNLVDRQAELQYSSPLGTAAPPSYYGGNKEDEDEEDEEANQVGMYRTRLNVRRKSLQGRTPSQ
eukprot:gene8479-4840_t